jgi:NAD(P)-dependent dehydrogenase (short-subunit alcohol dehydrogenase family)
MSNPVVLITGALTGIGRATDIAFAKEGARLVVAGRHEEAGQQLAAELRGLGADAAFIKADVQCDDEVRDLAIRPSRALAAWMRPSTPPALKANPAR